MRSRFLTAVPLLSIIMASAQATAISNAPAAQSTAAAQTAAAATREQVRAEVYRAMRDGSWRCATTNRGWCGTTPQDGPPARNPR
jgi:hypothetical protein